MPKNVNIAELQSATEKYTELLFSDSENNEESKEGTVIVYHSKFISPTITLNKRVDGTNYITTDIFDVVGGSFVERFFVV